MFFHVFSMFFLYYFFFSCILPADFYPRPFPEPDEAGSGLFCNFFNAFSRGEANSRPRACDCEFLPLRLNVDSLYRLDGALDEIKIFSAAASILQRPRRARGYSAGAMKNLVPA